MLEQVKKKLDEKMKELKTQKDLVEGTKCEVYSRVVGYLRPVSLWNEGKKEEFKTRKKYKLEDYKKLYLPTTK